MNPRERAWKVYTKMCKKLPCEKLLLLGHELESIRAVDGNKLCNFSGLKDKTPCPNMCFIRRFHCTCMYIAVAYLSCFIKMIGQQ